VRRPPNNGMNRTRNSVAFMLNHAGSPVIPGVRSPERASPILWAFQAGAVGRSNSGMHPTRDTQAVINLKRAGGRVMPALAGFEVQT
jgi:hypothetical protein